MKVGIVYHYKKEMLMEPAKNLNNIPNLQHITITHDLTEIQSKEETTLERKAGDQNLAPSKEMKEKGLVMKIVGPRGQRRIIAAPLRQAEEVDEEGRVRLNAGRRRREGGRSRGQEQYRAGVVTGANREPIGSREQGNGQGAAAERANGRELEEASRATEEEVRQLRQGGDKRRPERSSQSFGSGEEVLEGREKEKGRKEEALVRMLPVRREEGEENFGERSRFGMMKTTVPPSGSSSSSLLQQRVSAAAASPRWAVPGPQ